MQTSFVAGSAEYVHAAHYAAVSQHDPQHLSLPGMILSVAKAVQH